MRKISIIEKSDTLFSDLEKYISEVDKDWKNKIKGASDEEISKLYSVSKLKESGICFPNSYITYLKHMGKQDGGLLKPGLYNADTCIDVILNNYEYFACEESADEADGELVDFTNPQKFVFAYNEECEYGYYIYTLNNKQIIISGDEETYNLEYFSESFEKLLFQNAFLIYEKNYFKFYHKFGMSRKEYLDGIKPYSKKNFFDVINENLEKYGLKKAWFSDETHLFLSSEKLSVGIWKDWSVYGFIAGDDEEEVKEIGEFIRM